MRTPGLSSLLMRAMSALLTLILSLGLAVSASPTPAEAQSSTPGMSRLSGSSGAPSQSRGASKTKERSVFLLGQGSRRYLVELPPRYNPNKRYPVVVGFGGWRHTPERFQAYANLAHETRGQAIMVYPQGRNNAWAGAPYAKTSLRQDFDYVRAVIDDVASHHKIDRRRIYGLGLSNGGGFVVAAACHAPGLFDAVASVSGAYYSPTVTNCRRGATPTLIMHGEHDKTMHYRGGSRHKSRYWSVPGTFRTIGQRNGCFTPAPYRAHYGTRVEFEQTRCRAATTLIRVTDGAHTWFRHPGASDEAWDFLRHH